MTKQRKRRPLEVIMQGLRSVVELEKVCKEMKGQMSKMVKNKAISSLHAHGDKNKRKLKTTAICKAPSSNASIYLYLSIRGDPVRAGYAFKIGATLRFVFGVLFY